MPPLRQRCRCPAHQPLKWYVLTHHRGRVGGFSFKKKQPFWLISMPLCSSACTCFAGLTTKHCLSWSCCWPQPQRPKLPPCSCRPPHNYQISHRQLRQRNHQLQQQGNIILQPCYVCLSAVCISYLVAKCEKSLLRIVWIHVPLSAAEHNTKRITSPCSYIWTLSLSAVHRFILHLRRCIRLLLVACHMDCTPLASVLALLS
jgi:hypothetical protein